MSEKVQKVIVTGDAAKGAAARSASVLPMVTPNVPLREGARAPLVVTPPTIPTTSGPVSVTNPKK
jgi:hypothetical protein